MKNKFNSVAAVENYHIHIYFTPGDETQRKADALAAYIAENFSAALQDHIIFPPGGPHTESNHALHIKPEGFAAIVPWLQLNGQGLSILVHPFTGDEVRDHLECSMWLGDPVPYNMAWFDKGCPPPPPRHDR